MFNCIESDALMDVCRALGFNPYLVCKESMEDVADVYIAEPGSVAEFELSGSCFAFKLSDYLLATAPVDVKEACDG